METAQSAIQSAGKITKATAEMIARILDALADMIQKNDQGASARALAKWIKEGNGIYTYDIQGRYMKDMVMAELERQKVPYVKDLTGKLIVRDVDLEKVKEVNRQCLIAKGDYYQVVNSDELEDAIARTEKIRNKNVIEIKGLNGYEMENLKRKCNDISKGFMIGEHKNPDGSYNAMLHSQKAYEMNPCRTDFCEAAVKHVMSLYGPNGVTKIHQLENDAAMAKKIAALKDDDRTQWLVSADDPSRYVEFYTEKDESSGRAVAKGFRYVEDRPDRRGKTHPEVLMDLKSTDPDYDVELIRATDRIMNKAIISDYESFEEHRKTKERTVEPERLEKTREQYAVSQAETTIADRMNSMIKTASFDEKYRDYPADGFKSYRNEVFAIMDGLEKGQAVEPYRDEDMQALKETMDEAGISPADYRISIQKLMSMEVTEREAYAVSKEEVKESKEKTSQYITKTTTTEKSEETVR